MGPVTTLDLLHFARGQRVQVLSSETGSSSGQVVLGLEPSLDTLDGLVEQSLVHTHLVLQGLPLGQLHDGLVIVHDVPDEETLGEEQFFQELRGVSVILQDAQDLVLGVLQGLLVLSLEPDPAIEPISRRIRLFLHPWRLDYTFVLLVELDMDRLVVDGLQQRTVVLSE